MLRGDERTQFRLRKLFLAQTTIGTFIGLWIILGEVMTGVLLLLIPFVLVAAIGRIYDRVVTNDWDR